MSKTDAKVRRDGRLLLAGLFLAVALFGAFLIAWFASVVVVALAVLKWAWTYLFF